MPEAITIGDVVSIAERIGLIGLLFVILYGGAKPNPWWVFGWAYRQQRADLDQWRDAAVSGTSLADRAAALASDLSPRVIDAIQKALLDQQIRRP